MGVSLLEEAGAAPQQFDVSWCQAGHPFHGLCVARWHQAWHCPEQSVELVVGARHVRLLATTKRSVGSGQPPCQFDRFQEWWDSSTAAGAKQRPREAFNEPRPVMEILACDDNTLKCLGSYIKTNIFGGLKKTKAHVFSSHRQQKRIWLFEIRIPDVVTAEYTGDQTMVSVQQKIKAWNQHWGHILNGRRSAAAATSNRASASEAGSTRTHCKPVFGPET